MINWYAIIVLSFVISVLAIIVLAIFKIIPILLAALLYLVGIPLVMVLFGYIIYKLEQKGYIHDDEFPG
jgi:archaellum biogenesis protein FlaJ (TadC family)